MEIDESGIDPFAHILVSAYLATAADARAFHTEHDFPTTRMDKAHRFRSLVQASVGHSTRYALHPEYMESGRVQVTDTSTQWSCLIRSKSAIAIEEAMKSPGQLALFAMPRRTTTGLPSLLAYDFERTGMGLWSCPTKQMPQRKRLVPAGRLEFVGFWKFDTVTPPDGGGPTFDQGEVDPFEELGNPDLGEADEL